eukprot:767833-Hanusia_phi.AAC.3
MFERSRAGDGEFGHCPVFALGGPAGSEADAGAILWLGEEVCAVGAAVGPFVACDGAPCEGVRDMLIPILVGAVGVAGEVSVGRGEVKGEDGEGGVDEVGLLAVDEVVDQPVVVGDPSDDELGDVLPGDCATEVGEVVYGVVLEGLALSRELLYLCVRLELGGEEVDVGPLADDEDAPLPALADLIPPHPPDFLEGVDQALCEGDVAVGVGVEDVMGVVMVAVCLCDVPDGLEHVGEERSAVGVGLEVADDDDTSACGPGGPHLGGGEEPGEDAVFCQSLVCQEDIGLGGDFAGVIVVDEGGEEVEQYVAAECAMCFVRGGAEGHSVGAVCDRFECRSRWQGGGGLCWGQW